MTAASCAGIALAMLGALVGCDSSESASRDGSATQRDATMHDDAATHGDGDGDGDGDEGPGGHGDGDGNVVLADGAVDLDASDEHAHDATDSTDGGADAAVDGPDANAPDAMLPALEDLPYAREVIAFVQGSSAGYGQANYPDVVFGPPVGRGTGSGATDVLSLGVGGEIVLGFGDFDIVDGEGADFIVFENPFWASADPASVFAEPGEISVSEDGSTWHTFACDVDGNGAGEYEGCAGWTPTLRFDPQLVFPLDPSLTGGDAFDLSDLGLSRARYVRIKDLEVIPGSANTGGFDLDAVGLVHAEPRE